MVIVIVVFREKGVGFTIHIISWVINILSSGKRDVDATAWPDLARNVGVYYLGQSGYPAIVNLYLRYDDDSKVSPAALPPSLPFQQQCIIIIVV